MKTTFFHPFKTPLLLLVLASASLSPSLAQRGDSKDAKGIVLQEIWK